MLQNLRPILNARRTLLIIIHPFNPSLLMKRYFLGPLALLLPAAVPALAQAPSLINVSLAANALAVPRATGVVASFSQPLTAASVTALKVFSSQRGGLQAGGTATLIGANLGFFRCS
jgi:hypothetical protein